MSGVWADSFKVISILPYKILTVTSPGYAMQVLSVTVYRQRNQGLEHLRSFISETQTLISSFLSHSFQIPTLLCDQKKFYNIGHSVGNNLKKIPDLRGSCKSSTKSPLCLSPPLPSIVPAYMAVVQNHNQETAIGILVLTSPHLIQFHHF